MMQKSCNTHMEPDAWSSDIFSSWFINFLSMGSLGWPVSKKTVSLIIVVFKTNLK